MGKQKFCCKGVLRSTGQRVSTTVLADSRDAAIQIAAKHGVAVESAMPVAESAPAPPPKVANKSLDDRLDDILSAEDDELAGGPDDLGLDDDLDGAPASPSTKACPYCGEQILAVAVKCKHCGSYVGEKAAKTRQPSGSAPSQGTSTRTWAIIGGVVAVVVAVPIIIVLVFVLWLHLYTPSVTPSLPEPVAVAPAPLPTAPSAPTTPVINKPSPEEMAFAAKLTAFLDGCDELVRLLDKGAKADQLNKQSEAIKSRQVAIPRPPQDVSWAQQANESSKQLLLVVGMVSSQFAGQDVLEDLLKQSAGSTPDNREAYRQLAAEIRKLVTPIRGLFPPACLAKAK